MSKRGKKRDVKPCSSMTATLILQCQNINDDQRACSKRHLSEPIVFMELSRILKSRRRIKNRIFVLFSFTRY